MDVGKPGSSAIPNDEPGSTPRMAESPPPPVTGLLGSLRAFADGLLGSVRDRVELLSIELHEEKQRLIQSFIWVVAFLFTAMLALSFASFAVVVACWNTAARVPVVAGLAGLYAVLAVISGVAARRTLTRRPRPFAATLEELESDRECILPKS